jgi:hypothetical protein
MQHEKMLQQSKTVFTGLLIDDLPAAQVIHDPYDLAKDQNWYPCGGTVDSKGLPVSR